MKELIDRLEAEQRLNKSEYVRLLSGLDEAALGYLRSKSQTAARRVFGNKIYIRGLIEISSYCKNNCYYCGIRCANTGAERYRLNREQILDCCKIGYRLGFRTFVLQGGEDVRFTDEVLAEIISAIKKSYPDCAVTLSVGERSADSYRKLHEVGADRYLLRHETATPEHYARLHPKELSLGERKKCLYNLKQIGYQVGTGFMVGSPYQTLENLAEDLIFIQEFKPHMIGIGPFLPHKDTPFGGQPAGRLDLTLMLIGILRLMFPSALIPATTALGTLVDGGREQGILMGANVVMPNLSPTDVRGKYLLYDNKIATGEEAAEGIEKLRARLEAVGYEIAVDRGDYRQ